MAPGLAHRRLSHNSFIMTQRPLHSVGAMHNPRCNRAVSSYPQESVLQISAHDPRWLRVRVSSPELLVRRLRRKHRTQAPPRAPWDEAYPPSSPASGVRLGHPAWFAASQSALPGLLLTLIARIPVRDGRAEKCAGRDAGGIKCIHVRDVLTTQPQRHSLSLIRAPHLPGLPPFRAASTVLRISSFALILSNSRLINYTT
ncbi:hypothetical protein C8Q78DRAFT_840030 [Trametes maxima]|nr:hypothetical protein C8Q78DRAFT_840030 [Trametes maxima]